MRQLYTIILLICSNTFMTFAWYGHLKIKEYDFSKNWGLFTIIILSWLLAFFEYIFMIPANKYGFKENGGPYSLIQLKIIQEAISLIVFVVFSTLLFKNETIRWNHYAAFILIMIAVILAFKK